MFLKVVGRPASLCKFQAARSVTLANATTSILTKASAKTNFSVITQLHSFQKLFTTVSQTTNPTQFANSNITVPEPTPSPATLRLLSGQTFHGSSFGSPITTPLSGEVVFTTSLVGYPESMTDPSYRGQILVFTQPLIGNYGIPNSNIDQWGLLENFESGQVQVKAIIVNDYATKYSHWKAVESLGQWCAKNGVVAISGVDTRAVVTVLRERGSTLGQISSEAVGDIGLEDPNVRNLAAEVSTKERLVYNEGAPLKIALIDCGVKQNIIRCLVSREVEVHTVPWDHDLVADEIKYDGVFISNGPGVCIF
ncbi:Multifunctional pyrimidine synthesis protein CAD [Nowakowskiella sp. JEL0078]|nr:Multifunctional pyrimidine synthesis protein CAD [Nowakowskiella sp. JEL0078]